MNTAPDSTSFKVNDQVDFFPSFLSMPYGHHSWAFSAHRNSSSQRGPIFLLKSAKTPAAFLNMLRYMNQLSSELRLTLEEDRNEL